MSSEAIEIKVPVLPESVANASVATWHKKPGEPVSRDEPLVDIETDKVVLEVVAPEDGVLEKIIKNTGEIVLAQETIASFMPGNAALKKSAGVQSESQTQPQVKSQTQAVPSQTAKTEQAPEPVASPAARRRMGEGSTQASSAQKSAPVAMPMPISEFTSGNGRPEKRVPMTRLRARIAERLLSAQHNAAILTTFNEVNMQPIMDLRARHKETFEKTHGVKLGFMSFFSKAVIEALKKFPAVNASLDGNDIVYHGYYDLSIAVSTERGLVVPVLRNVQDLSMADIERQILALGEKAKSGHLTIEEMTGGTFTLSNGGVFGSLLSTPILNPPQTGILGMHKIEERAVVEKGQIVIKPMMYLALSYDHRLIDGKESVQFLVAVKELLEDPSGLLLEI